MSNVVLYTDKPSWMVRAGKSVHLPYTPEFKGLGHFPPWLHFWRETKYVFHDIRELDIGNGTVTPYACNCGFGRNRGWDLNVPDLLAFAQPDRSPWDSWLFLGEVVLVLDCYRGKNASERLPGPFFFIVPGWSEALHLLVIRRTNDYGFCIDSSRELSLHDMIPRQRPLFIPDKPR